MPRRISEIATPARSVSAFRRRSSRCSSSGNAGAAVSLPRLDRSMGSPSVPREDGPRHEPCAPRGRPFRTETLRVRLREPCETSRNAEKCIYTYVYTSRVESVVFEVLADSTRRRIVETLGAGERPVHALVEAVDIQQSGVSRHLRILHEAGFVRVRAEGQERLYSLCAEPFRELDKWMRQYRGLWEARLDRFGAELNRRQKARAGKRRETHS